MPNIHDIAIKPAVDWVLPVPKGWIDLIRATPGQVVYKGGVDGIDIEALGAAKASIHQVAVTGTAEFHDYETFGSDEHGFRAFRSETQLSTDDISVTILDWEAGFGGEERVEIDMSGSLREDGVLIASLEVRFYEGATEGTTELEDSKALQTAVARGGVSNFTIHLANDEDDWATVRGTISNRLIKK
ncbi:hypothetical protein ACFQRL_08950 [Microbacterium fluvii]|uniref:Uncharacterized protein n=1 Tax=Microbacterium fluvii TaxID=415215 RepID=A0ABW2HCX9_9MICO|nr:hypothetical protein [Microbacterium fluvii]MCU4672715.1 hypothetical protein [Microbacterium fluvii]